METANLIKKLKTENNYKDYMVNYINNNTNRLHDRLTKE